MLYRNTGARFQQEDGTTVEKNAVFAPTEFDLRHRRHKIRPVSDYGTTVSARPSRPRAAPVAFEAVSTPAPPKQSPAELVAAGWVLKMTPTRYLELHPEGPNADLARSIVDAKD